MEPRLKIKVAFAPHLVSRAAARAACCVVFAAICRNIPHDRELMEHHPLHMLG